MPFNCNCTWTLTDETRLDLERLDVEYAYFAQFSGEEPYILDITIIEPPLIMVGVLRSYPREPRLRYAVHSAYRENRSRHGH